MSAATTSIEHLLAENERLRGRLDEAEATLAAIRNGEVDALVVAGPQGDQIFTLSGADRSYRILVEEMHQGAVTLDGDGIALVLQPPPGRNPADSPGDSPGSLAARFRHPREPPLV